MTVRENRGRQVVEFQLRGRRVFRRLPPEIDAARARDLEAKLKCEIFDSADLRDEPSASEAATKGRLDPDAWTRVVGLILSAKPIAPAPGVYFLCSGKRLMYVGKSRNVAARLVGHVGKEFDSVSMVPLPVDQLAATEALLIRMLRPPLNGTLTGRKRVTSVISRLVPKASKVDGPLDGD